MKKFISILLAIVLVSNISAQESKRTTEDFSYLKISNAVEVFLQQGEQNEIIISGLTEEDQNKVITEVKNGVLIISTKGKIKTNSIIVNITYKHLDGIEQSGASEISTTTPIVSEQFELKGSGAIEAKLALNVKQLSVDYSGASDIKLSGTADVFNIKLSGASDLKASEMIAKKIVIDVSGASDVKVYASEEITGKASGASSVNIKGNPAVREINTNIASSASFGNRDNVSIDLGNGSVDIQEEDVSVSVGKSGVDVINDTTRIKIGETIILVIDDSVHIQKPKKKRRNHWAGIDVGINGYLNSANEFNLNHHTNLAVTNPQKVTQFMELDYAKSWFVSVNFFEQFIKIKQHHFGLVTGLGLEWNNYELKHNVRLTPQGGAYVFNAVDEFNKDYTWGVVDTSLSYSKNRFKTFFINAPLMLEVNTGQHKNKSFHMSTGAIIGFNIQTKMKYKYKDNGNTIKDKDKQSFNTNPFKVSLTTRIGYGWFNVFATYSLTPLFESGRGPELYPFTVGVSLIGF